MFTNLSQLRPTACMLLACVCLTLQAVPARAQMTTGGGTSGGGIGAGPGSGVGAGGGGGFGPGAASSVTNFAPTTSAGPTQSVGTNVTGAGLGRTGTTLTPPTSSNPFAAFYANPYAAGLASSVPGQGNRKATATGGIFGQPSLATVATATQAGLASVGVGQNMPSFSTIGLRKAPPYVTALSDDLPLPLRPPGKLEQDLREVLLRSSRLKNSEDMQVVVVDNIVFLRGWALTDRQRELAEALVRLTPGVADVQNELLVRLP